MKIFFLWHTKFCRTYGTFMFLRNNSPTILSQLRCFKFRRNDSMVGKSEKHKTKVRSEKQIYP
jgi:hypothetical protein